MGLTAQVSYYTLIKVIYKKNNAFRLHYTSRPDGPSGRPVNQPIINLYNGAAVRRQVTKKVKVK